MEFDYYRKSLLGTDDVVGTLKTFAKEHYQLNLGQKLDETFCCEVALIDGAALKIELRVVEFLELMHDFNEFPDVYPEVWYDCEMFPIASQYWSKLFPNVKRP